jgi:hypothetical protein
MNDQSPPKRVTRARAATKTTDTGVKTTKIATAAAKAKITRSLSTAKRTTSASDSQYDELNDPIQELIEPERSKPRGRPRKVPVIQPEPEMEETTTAPPPKPRGRPRKVVVDAPAPAPAPEPSRPRGRPRKIDNPEVASIVVEAPARTTRTRTATVSKAAAPKKSVQFEEPGKENVVPAPSNANGKEKEVATGLRAKPVRKPVTTAARATRGQPRGAAQKSAPLSPKKTTQVATGKDNESDDELAGTGKTPTKPLMMSPIKPAGSVFTSSSTKKLNFSSSNALNTFATKDLGGSIMASPARRPPSSPFKESLNTSPQAPSLGNCLLRSPLKLPLPPQKSTTTLSAPLAAPLLQSPARRLPSPTKVAENGSPSRTRNNNSIDGATPNTFKISKFATPRTLTQGAVRAGQMLRSNRLAHASTGSPTGSSTGTKDANESDMLSVPKFSGRLSSILPRDSDPALAPSEPIVEMEDYPEIVEAEDPMVIDEAVTVVGGLADSQTTTPPASPPKASTGAFNLREVDENPFQDSDSEDEFGSESRRFPPTALAGFGISSPNFASSPATPTPFTAISKTPRAARSVAQRSDSKTPIGFTPLAKQLSNWMPASPEKSGSGASENGQTISVDMGAAVQPSPARNSYFDDEMSVRDEMQIATEEPEHVIEENDFSPVELDDEDYALAHEADEMSLLEPDQLENVEHAMDGPVSFEPAAEDMADEFINTEQGHANEMMDEFVHTDSAQVENSGEAAAQVENFDAESAPSEVSQEYGDENVIPIDPALLALDAQTPMRPKFVTPKRVLTERVFHTVSKVPLKSEAGSSSVRASPVKRSASISKLPSQWPANNLTRSKTVISYSPSKRARSRSPRKDAAVPSDCATPSAAGADVWSTIGTPARTPRRDLNTALLRGAVVFVDVHTTEGADASGLFTELLTQMGARCVKRWDWNGSKEDGSKIGITHVVFKDGGRRTLEKAKETGGVISCVGVGWVLE